MQVYAWQLSILFLAGAVLCMISGMIFLVWSAVAEDVGRGKGFDDNGKPSSSDWAKQRCTTRFQKEATLMIEDSD
ncbi:hypothetical protein COL516b_011367 [Colletotrichum fioriniae]|nr:uncharacterized protein COL516b_011367 [Colletotrichum fioriniae]KAJ0296667.1 hypothetical protein COL516b_011367 [Colletotrichum fioriniae]